MVIKRTMVLGILCFWFVSLQAFNTNITTSLTDTIPRVFTLGAYDGVPFERIKQNYETNMLTACKSDVEGAYYIWIHMLKYMETHSKKVGYDLNGIKLWLYAFYDKDGTIHHLAYYPKPNSKNFKAEEMTAFLTDFCKTYKSPLKYDKNYSNYSNANFPVLVEIPVSVEPKSVGSKGLGNNK